MSHPLSTFTIRVGKPLQSAEAAATVADFNGSPVLFSENAHVPDSNFLASQSEAPDTFLNLGEPLQRGGLTEEQPVTLGGNSIIENEVAGAPLLCIDPSTGLHVIVHDLCETLQQPTVPQNPQDGEESPDQFVVVWDLQTDSDPSVLVKPNSSGSKGSTLGESSCQESVLNPSIMAEENNTGDDHGIRQIFTPSIGSTLDLGLAMSSTQSFENNGIGKTNKSATVNIHEPAEQKLQRKDTSLIDCHEASMLTLQVPDGKHGISSGAGFQEDILMEAVPHINLEEIIEKFTSESNHGFMETETNMDTSACQNKDVTVNGDNTMAFQNDLSTSQRTFTVLEDENAKADTIPKVTVKVKTSVSVTEDSLDEDSFYDVLTTYHCKLCSEVFLDKGRLLKHYREIHKSRKGVKVFVTSDSSVGKKESTSPLKTKNLMSCKYCFRTFLGTKEWQNHISLEHSEELKKGTRKKKPKVVLSLPTQPSVLFRHHKSRQTTEEEEGEKKESKRPIRTPKDLDEQYWLQKQKPKAVMVNNKERTVKCSFGLCRFKFSSEEIMNEHRKCHGHPGTEDEKCFVCSYCSKKFPKWGGCQLHLWNAHFIDLDLYTCGICNTYKTIVEQKLLIHQEIHSDAREYVCKYCGKAFNQHSQLLNHEVIHQSDDNVPQWHQKSYCDKCDRWFGDSKLLKKHINTVHLKVKSHSCAHCSYKCFRKYDLKNHMRKHTGEKPIKCELCGQSFSNLSTRRRHKWSHFLTKPFKCPNADCEYEATHIENFKKHLTKKHPEEKLIYKCQSCSFQDADLRIFNHHIGVHEEHLFKEAMERRARSTQPSTDSNNLSNSLNQSKSSNAEVPMPSTLMHETAPDISYKMDSFLPSTVLPGTAPDLDIKMDSIQPATLAHKTTPDINFKIGAPDLDIKMDSIQPATLAHKTTPDINFKIKNIQKQNKVDHTNQQVQSMFSEKAEFVFEEGVLRVSDTRQKSCSDNKSIVTAVGGNLTSDLTVSVNISDFKSSMANKLDVVKCNAQSSFKDINSESYDFGSVNGVQNGCNPNSQVYTIDVGNLETSTNFLKDTTIGSLPGGQPDQVMQTDILVPNSHETSLLNVNNQHIEPKLLGDKTTNNHVLNVESAGRTPIINIEEEHRNLLSHVMSDDGHQYIIGISPEEISASQSNIFTL